MYYNLVSYYSVKATPGNCFTDVGPQIIIAAHRGKLDGFKGVAASILGGSSMDPVWIQAMKNVGDQLVSQRIRDAHAAAMAAQRAAQAAYQRSNSMRETLQRRSESQSRVMQGWTDTLTGTDRWSDGSSTRPAPSGYNYGWSNGSGESIYTNDSTFNPNHSSDFRGDWSQMQRTPW